MLIFIGISAQGEPLKMSPYKIILNAKCVGASQDIQAIISIYLPSATFAASEATLSIDGCDSEFVATSLRYCIIDDNLLISFNREEIQNALKAQGIDGEVGCTVEGFVEFADYPRESFSGESTVEVLSPGGR